MKKIVFIPDAYYLSDPIYLTFAENLKKLHEITYLDLNFPMSFSQVDRLLERKKEVFPHYVKVQNDDYQLFEKTIYKSNLKQKLLSIPKFILNYRTYIVRVKKKLKEIDAEIVILTSDMLLPQRDVCKWVLQNNKKCLIYQSAFLEIAPYSTINRLKNFFYYVFFNKVMNIPLGRKQDTFGNEYNKSILVLWGQFFAKDYKKMQEKKRIRIFGNPYYEKILVKGNEKIKRKIYSSKEKITILICTQAFGALINRTKYNEVVSLYQYLVESDINANYVIKIHPRENIDDYSNFMNIANVSLVRDKDIVELYFLSDIHISVASLTSFEALLAGLPIILIMPNTLCFFDNFNNQVEERVYTGDELVNKINVMKTEKYYNEFIVKRKNYLIDKLQNNSLNLLNDFIENECR